jgi:hypothetical protein
MGRLRGNAKDDKKVRLVRRSMAPTVVMRTTHRLGERVGASGLGVPVPVVGAVRFGHAILEELLVILILNVVSLHPNPGDVYGLAMRGEPPVSLVDIGAEVRAAGDHIFAVVARLFQVLRPEIAFVDPLEQRRVGLDPSWSELVLHHYADGLGHTRVVGGHIDLMRYSPR